MTHVCSTGSQHQSINFHSSIEITSSSSSSYIPTHETSSHIGYQYVEEVYGSGPNLVHGAGAGDEIYGRGQGHNKGGSITRGSNKGGLVFNEEGLAPVETPAATQHLSQALLHPSNHHHHSTTDGHHRARNGSPSVPGQGLALAPALLLPLPHLTDEQFEAYFKVDKGQGLARRSIIICT